MAEEGMSIVPYGSSNHDIVLRHNDSVVVFDRDSQQLVLRNASDSNANLELTDCPYCHRPMRDDNSGQDSRHPSPQAQPEFVNPNYFRLLHASLPSSVDSSNQPSSRRRLTQPALSDGLTSEEGSSRGAHGISSAAFIPNYFKKFFVEESVLGKGGKGVVLLVKHVLDGVSLGYYACKRVPVGDDHEWLEKVLGEVQLLQHLSHQNLVSYRHVWLENAKISTFGPSVPCAFILQQYCNAGDLHNYICGAVQSSTTTQQLKERMRRKSKGEPEPPSELGGPRILHFDEIYSFFKDITSGLRYLHMNGYIHRDLKPHNCLLHETSDGLRVLVSDFGEVQAQDTTRLSTGATGTVSYCAPEVLRREYPGGPFGNFTFKSDIFSLGMILYFLCFAQLPYRNADLINEEKEDVDRLREEISQWTGFDDARRMRPDLPEKLYTFLQRLLSVDPDRRPSADEVLSGIQAGVNGNENFRFRRSSSTSPDLPTNSRFHPVDDRPTPSFARPARNRPSRSPAALRRSPYESNGTKTDPPPFVDDVRLERRSSLSPERELIIRPMFSSTPPFSPNHVEPAEGGHAAHNPPPQQHLLPPPPNTSYLTRLFPFIPTAFPQLLSLPFLQLVLFLAEIILIFHPCTPLAVNPLVLYPLLLLAGLSLRTRSLKLQIIALGFHLAVVSLSMRFELLCI